MNTYSPKGSLILNYNMFEKCLDISHLRLHISKLRTSLINFLIVSINQILYDEDLVIQLDVNIVLTKRNHEY